MRTSAILLLLGCGVQAAEAVRPAPAVFVADPHGTGFILSAPGLRASFLPRELLLESGSQAIHLQFIGANPSSRISSSVTLESICYRDLYAGIDMVYSAPGRGLKREFLVRPGADPSVIRMHVEGNGVLYVDDASGDLIWAGADTVFREEAPYIYQIIGGKRVQVPGRFRTQGEDSVTFEIGAYDRGRLLVIDPVMTVSSYYGGSGLSAITSVAMDSGGNAYFAGWTETADLPQARALPNEKLGGVDAFVAKVSPAGTLVYATYLGGSGDDRALAITVNAGGVACVTGSTSSANFPVVAAMQAASGGGRDGFVACLSAAGTQLLFSTYLGGFGADSGTGIGLDTQGNIYVTGNTTSTNFPTYQAYKTSNAGRQDVFLCKLSAGGQRLFATYFGGSGDDAATGIAVDPAGQVHITGTTNSLDFPTKNAAQARNGGGYDAFVAKFQASGNDLVYSTYLGGSGDSPESGMAIALDGNGNAWVTGSTTSPNFPVLNALRSAMGSGTIHAFLTSIGVSGTLRYSTFLGGHGVSVATAIAVDAGGNPWVAGYTSAQDWPIADGMQSAQAGLYDAFLTEVNAAGTALVFSTLLGGSGSDTAAALAVSNGAVWMAGQTFSNNLPLINMLQSGNRGGASGFLVRMTSAAVPIVGGVTPSSGSAASQTFTFTFSSDSGAQDISWVEAIFNTNLNGSAACYLYYDPGSQRLGLINDDSTALLGWAPLRTGGSLENSRCSVDASASSATTTGNLLTLNIALTLKPLFSGALGIFARCFSADRLDSGWKQLGTWDLAGKPPTIVGVAPASGSGSSQIFTFTFSDPVRGANIVWAQILFAPVLNGRNACYIFYDPQRSLVYLVNDGSTAYFGPGAPGTAAILENSQCMVNLAASSQSTSGQLLQLQLVVAFKTAFAGANNVYLDAVGQTGLDSGWWQAGAWTVPGALQPPLVVSVSPASGAGSSTAFTFTFSEPGGTAANLLWIQLLIHSILNGRGACYMYYDPLRRNVYLVNDAVTAAAMGAAGGGGTLGNGQCSISLAGVFAVQTASSLALTVPVAFKSGFTGTRYTYADAIDLFGFDSGWRQAGSWTVAAP